MKNKEDALDFLHTYKNDLSISSYDRISELIGNRSLNEKAISEESLMLLIAIETNKSNHPELISEVMRRLDAPPKKDLLKKKIGLIRSK